MPRTLSKEPPNQVASYGDADGPGGPLEPTKTALELFIDVFHEDWKALPLAAKLAKIGGTLGNIPKKGWNPNQNYKFARETDLVAAIRPYLAAAGILITFSVVDHQILQRPNPDAKGMLTHITLRWTVTDGKESIEGEMPGYGMDAGDKGVYKAITGAKKYVLMTLFLIDTGDDPEAEAKDKPEPVGKVVRQIMASAAGEYLDDEPAPVVTPLSRTDTVRGGHTTAATDTQRARLIEAIRVRSWTARQFLQFVRDELQTGLIDAPEDSPDQLRAYINALLDNMTPSDMGHLILEMERE